MRPLPALVLVCVITACLGTAASAEMFGFPQRATRPSLFAVNEVEDPDNEKTGNVGRFGMGLHTAPWFFTRIGVQPGAMLWAFGVEVSGFWTPTLGVVADLTAFAGFSFDTGSDALFAPSSSTGYGWQSSLLLRYRINTWTRGSAYVHAGPTVAYFNAQYGGKYTWSLGADLCFGAEFGHDWFRGFIESGLTLYFALNRRDAGWLSGNNGHGIIGAHITILRGGFRFYV